ncbi:MAG: OmcA/MtrC family decaheme c-type cytochrome [Bryobacteraceae bacterium]
MKVTRAEIATDGTIRAWVQFTDPAGRGLDRLGVQTPGAITVSFLIAYLPADGPQFVSYITRQRVSGANTATQATGENNGTWQAQTADGEYLYTFASKAPANVDRNATHRVAIYGSRTLTDFNLGTSRADGWLDFVPSGAPLTKVRDVVRTSSCNKCHDQLALHGGNRRSVQVCVVCHTPQTTDPASGNTVDLKVMVHKIHRGASLPSVVAKGKYFIGNADYSDVVNPAPGQDCAVCHEPQKTSGAAQADNWMTAPSRAACGSCHDNVNFTTGQGHPAGPFNSDTQCSQCHTPAAVNDFDASVPGAHMVPQRSHLLEGLVANIESVESVAPGKKPIVTFTLENNAGTPVAAADLTTLRLYMAGPTTDIPGYTREDAKTAKDAGGGRYMYTFTVALPDSTKGTWQFGIEAYRNLTLMAGTTKQRTVRESAPAKVMAVTADGKAVQARRAIVATEKCMACHTQFGFHGGARNNIQLCSFCHNPTLVAGTPNESYNFTNLIHRIHNEEVRYPGNVTTCTQCHLNNTQLLPLREGLMNVTNPAAPMTPAPPATNACLSCHNETPAWSHAAVNTSRLGESCSVCHGPNSDFAVAKVHAQ